MQKKKTAEPEAQAVDEQRAHEDTTKSQKSTPNKWGGRLIWGALLVAVGVVLLLDNLGVVDISLLSLWKLWPVLIVVTGLSILSLKGWLAGLVYGLTAVAIAVLTWFVLTSPVEVGETKTSDSFSINKPSSTVKQLDLTINSGAGTLNIGSHDNGDLVRGELKDDRAELKQTSSVDGDRQIVDLSIDKDWALFGSNQSQFNVDIGRNIPTNIHIKSGASKVDADLSSVALKSLNIDSGASSIDVKLGSKLDESKIDIDSGASSADILVPASAGVKLTFNGGLSSRHLPSDYQDIDSNVYQSANFDKADKKIIINVDMGVSSFKLSTY